MATDYSTPVVVLPCGIGYSSICIMRSLARLGVPVYAVECVSGSFASRSRYCAGKFVWNDQLPPARSVECLLEAGRKIGRRAILIATTDASVTLVAENAAALRERFIFPEISSQLVHSLCSKREMHRLVSKLGIATPKAAFPSSRLDVLRFLESAVFPMMLKGIDGNRLAKRSGKRMFLVHDESELLEKYEMAEDPDHPNLMLQEYIPGGDESVCVVNAYFSASSDCIFSATGNKIRQWPAYQGVTTLGVCRKNETVEKVTCEFMKAIGYRGILDAGYRYDSRDGMYKVLDVNPRIGCTFRLFVAQNGMDVARALYLDLTGQPVPVAPVREGRKWIAEDLDLLSSIRYLGDRKVTVGQWIKSFRGVEGSAHFAIDDPLPFFAMCLQRGGGLLKRIYRKLTRRNVRELRAASFSPNTWA